jgi:tetratricopeptide (TPR) repeat protein
MSHAKTLKPALDRLGRGDSVEAIALANAALAEGFADLRQITAFAEKLRTTRHPHESLPFFDHVLSKNPDNIDAAFGKAKGLADTNQKHLSMLEVDRIKVLAANDAALEIRLVELLVYMTAYRLAEERLTEMIRARPSLFLLRRHLINMHLQRGSVEAMRNALDDAATIPDLSAADLSFIARSYLQAKRPVPASTVALRLVELTPPPAIAEHLLLAQAYLDSDSKQKAEQVIERCRAALEKPQDLLRAAEIYLATGNTVRYRELADRFVAAYDGKAIPMLSRIQLAAMLGKVGDADRARALLDTIPIDMTDDRQVVRLLHNTAYDLGYYSLAERSARQGLILKPYDPQYLARANELQIIGHGAPPAAKKPEAKPGFFARFRRT